MRNSSSSSPVFKLLGDFIHLFKYTRLKINFLLSSPFHWYPRNWCTLFRHLWAVLVFILNKWILCCTDITHFLLYLHCDWLKCENNFLFFFIFHHVTACRPPSHMGLKECHDVKVFPDFPAVCSSWPTLLLFHCSPLFYIFVPEIFPFFPHFFNYPEKKKSLKPKTEKELIHWKK